jgi:hypothetical protein
LEVGSRQAKAMSERAREGYGGWSCTCGCAAESVAAVGSSSSVARVCTIVVRFK